jgi:hypothetical protein
MPTAATVATAIRVVTLLTRRKAVSRRAFAPRPAGSYLRSGMLKGYGVSLKIT